MELQHGDGSNVVAMKIVGANAGSRPVGLDKQAGVSNHFAGNDPLTSVPLHPARAADTGQSLRLASGKRASTYGAALFLQSGCRRCAYNGRYVGDRGGHCNY
jgi:hypothetical protein